MSGEDTDGTQYEITRRTAITWLACIGTLKTSSVSADKGQVTSTEFSRWDVDVSYNPREDSTFHDVWADPYYSQDLVDAIDAVDDPEAVAQEVPFLVDRAPEDVIRNGVPEDELDTHIARDLYGVLKYKQYISRTLADTAIESGNVDEATRDLILEGVGLLNPTGVPVADLIDRLDDAEEIDLTDEELIADTVDYVYENYLEPSVENVASASDFVDSVVGIVSFYNEILGFGFAWRNEMMRQVPFLGDVNAAVVPKPGFEYGLGAKTLVNADYNQPPYIEFRSPLDDTIVDGTQDDFDFTAARGDPADLQSLLRVEERMVLPLFDHALQTEDDELLEVVARHYDKLLDAQRSLLHDMVFGIRYAMADDDASQGGVFRDPGRGDAENSGRIRPEAVYSHRLSLSESVALEDLELDNETDFDTTIEPAIDPSTTVDVLTDTYDQDGDIGMTDPHLYGGPSLTAETTKRKYDGAVYAETDGVGNPDATDTETSYDDLRDAGELGIPIHALERVDDLGFEETFDCDGSPVEVFSPADDSGVKSPPYHRPGDVVAADLTHYGIDIRTPLGYLYQGQEISQNALEEAFCDVDSLIPVVDPLTSLEDASDELAMINDALFHLSMSDILSTAAVTQQGLVHTAAPLYGTRSIFDEPVPAQPEGEQELVTMDVQRVLDIRGRLDDGDVVTHGDELTVEAEIETPDAERSDLDVEFTITDGACGDDTAASDTLGTRSVTVDSSDDSQVVEWSGPVETQIEDGPVTLCAETSTDAGETVRHEVISLELTESDTAEVAEDRSGSDDGLDIADEVGPGFGAPGAVTAAAAAGYLLKRRLTNVEDTSH